MNIAQALKQKNRVIGEMNKVFAQIQKHNVIHYRGESSFPPTHKVNVKALLSTYRELFAKLVAIKAGVQKASAPIAEKLVELAETKSLLSKMQEIPTKEGTETISGYNAAPYEVTFVSAITESAVVKTSDELQDQINRLQDEIDTHNALTQIDL